MEESVHVGLEGKLHKARKEKLPNMTCCPSRVIVPSHRKPKADVAGSLPLYAAFHYFLKATGLKWWLSNKLTLTAGDPRSHKMAAENQLLSCPLILPETHTSPDRCTPAHAQAHTTLNILKSQWHIYATKYLEKMAVILTSGWRLLVYLKFFPLKENIFFLSFLPSFLLPSFLSFLK